MLYWIVQRTRRATGVEVMVATSVDPSDDPLAAWCDSEGIPCYRGPLDDVLSRYSGAARAAGADVVVRITADCPFVDATVVEAIVTCLVQNGLEYAGNNRQRTYPHGADVEAFTVQALEIAAREATEPFEREHVTPFIWTRPERFAQRQVLSPAHLTRPELRITVDTIEDYMLAVAIYEELDNGYASLEDVVDLVDRKPWLPYINRDVRQKGVFTNPDHTLRIAEELLEGARMLLTQDMFNASLLLSSRAVDLAAGTESPHSTEKLVAVRGLEEATQALSTRRSVDE